MKKCGRKDYSTTGSKAWRVVLISAINYAIEQNYLSLEWDKNENRGATPSRNYDFSIVGIYPCHVRMFDIGFGELSFECKVIVRERLIECIGWVERKTGFYLQRSQAPIPLMKPNRGVEIRELAMFSEYVNPNGYSDTGKMYF